MVARFELVDLMRGAIKGTGDRATWNDAVRVVSRARDDAANDQSLSRDRLE